MRTEIAEQSNQSWTQRSLLSNCLLWGSRTRCSRGATSIFLLSQITRRLWFSPSPANEEGVGGRGSGELMDLIGGVTLIISGETTRCGVREVVWARGREAGRTMSVFTVSRCSWEDGETERRPEKRWRVMSSCHKCRRDVTSVYLRCCVTLTGVAVPHVWAEWNSMFTES